MSTPTHDPTLGWSPAAIAVRRPVTTWMLLLALSVLSAIAWQNIRMELIPSGFTPPFLFVQIPTMASSPEDVGESVVKPVEDGLSTVRNLERMETTASANAGTFLLQFRDGTHMDVAYNQVRDRVDDALRDSNAQTGPYFVWKYNPNDDPLAWLGVSVDEGTQKPELVIRRQLVPLLERVPGVSRVDVMGLPDEKVAVDVDGAAVRVIPGGLPVLVERIQRAQATVSAGSMERVEGALPLRVVAPLDSIQELRRLDVAPGTRVEDLARVHIVDEKADDVYRVNGRPGIFISIYKESTANVVDTSRAVRAVLASAVVTDATLQGFDYHYFFDQGELIEGSLSQLQSSALVGGLLAVVCLFVFLRRLSVTLLVALCIPACLLLTVAAMYATGRTLNVLSLTGMMLAVGMLVDNAIVVVEAIELRIREGVAAPRAAVEGAQEVALPVLVSTLTTLVVFLPLTLMTGSETLSFYLSNIGFPVCVGLVASLFVSLVVVPLASQWAFRPAVMTRILASENKGRAASVGGSWMERVTRAVEAVLAWVLRRPVDAVLVSLIAFVSMAVPFQKVARLDGMDPNMNDVRISLDFDPAMTWDEKVRALDAHEAVLVALRDRYGLRDIRVGLGDIGIGDSELRVFLADDPIVPREDVIVALRGEMPDIPGVVATVGGGGGMPTAKNASPTIQLVGPDTGVLRALVEDAAQRIRRIEGVDAVHTSSSSALSMERLYRIDGERAARAGVSPILVTTAIDMAVRGREVGSIGTVGAQLPVLVRQDAVTTVDDIAALEIGAGSGIQVGALSDARNTQELPSIRRVNRETQLELTIETQRTDLDVLMKDVYAALDDMAFPRGYGLRSGGAFEAMANAAKEQVFAIGLAIVFVFLLVGVLFESFVLPFAVLWSIPFAFVGVFWFLWLTGTSFDVMAAVGLLVLVGVVVNTAIVLVDYARVREREGATTTDALMDATTRRLRPICMTALTTIVGLVPMAMGTATLVGIPYAPLGRAVIGGMLASTLLSLFVVPLFYSLLQRARRATQRALQPTSSRATTPRTVDSAVETF